MDLATAMYLSLFPCDGEVPSDFESEWVMLGGGSGLENGSGYSAGSGNGHGEGWGDAVADGDGGGWGDGYGDGNGGSDDE